MSAHMKKPRTKNDGGMIRVRESNAVYIIPRSVAEKYRVVDTHVSVKDVFANINQQYSKPGALLKGIRIRENLTQTEMADLIKVTQSDISQIENGTRNVGRRIAQRIEKLFGVDYRSFLE